MRVVYATEGSPCAVRAGELLAGLPLDADSTILVVHVGSPTEPENWAEVAVQAREVLEHATGAIETHPFHGPVPETLARACRELDADLLVLGFHRRPPLVQWVLGSTAARLAHTAPCPVWVVRSDYTELHRVLVGVDESDQSSELVRWLSHLPLPADCELRLLHVIPNLTAAAEESFLITAPLAERTMPLADWQRDLALQRVEALAGVLRAASKKTVTEVRSGEPAGTLLNAARDGGADLIVVGAHQRGRIEVALLGSVSRRILNEAPCSVLIVRRG
jgi:nucleotide-binding universal stress UspA family protein